MSFDGRMAAFTEAWNKHDAHSFSMVFAEDADFTNVSGMGAHGRTEIANVHAPVFATVFKESQQKIVDARIRFIKPDVAAVDARWEMTGARTRDGTSSPLRKRAADERLQIAEEQLRMARSQIEAGAAGLDKTRADATAQLDQAHALMRASEARESRSLDALRALGAGAGISPDRELAG